MAVKLPNDKLVSLPIKRTRWATQRIPDPRAQAKRHGIMSRFHKNAGAEEKTKESVDGTQTAEHGVLEPADSDGSDEEGGSVGHRRIFVNIPLPADAKDEDGRPISHFGRNKIRTAKYTPLSFVPKNLWYQFHNVANIYFLFIDILSIFSIFGATNPALNAVPLIVILFITAVKDGIEDWRRTVLDNELNNSPVHRLVDWNNVNNTEDDISLWRRMKKATSRTILFAFRKWQNRKQKGSKASNQGSVNDLRLSSDTRHTKRTSMAASRRSFHSAIDESERAGIQMTPVPSPSPHGGHDSEAAQPGSGGRATKGLSYEDSEGTLVGNTSDLQAVPHSKRLSAPPPTPNPGSLIDHHKQVPDKARFKRDYWKNVMVGDFVRIYNNDQIPADIVVLSTSDADGACYVETKNLDGETNLKVRQALRCGRKMKHARDCERADFVIESEENHANLYNYSGVIRWKQRDVKKPDAPRVDSAEAISIGNILLRGCSLRNTDWILGLVIFTGRETKILLNSGLTPSKRSRIARELNWNVVYNFIILFLMCLLAGIVNGVTLAKGNNSSNFFEFGSIGGKPSLDGFITFWTSLILFQNLVPISLYISLEIIKTAQAYFIYSDTAMYYDRIDYPCTPKSWNISDDLGQIEYIFSDKTGTLTQNVMEFKKCTINGIPYGEAYTEAQAGMQRRLGIDTEEEGAKAQKQIAKDRVEMLASLRKMHDNPYLRDDDVTFVAPDFVADLGGAGGSEQRRANENFMLALALCHTVITEKTPGDPPKIEFKAQSPDEAALVATARDCGFTSLGRSDDGLIVNELGNEREYKILNTLEFNSTRKRMSAIVRTPDNRIILFCKGADSIIYARLRRGEQMKLRKETAEHLEMFAREGLRTLCIAQKELGEEEYRMWNKEFEMAASAIQDREDKVEMLADSIERDLTLLGGTAIEDRLQDGVPDTIALLGDAGIKLWVLTGDKVETAINIGFSCNLLDNSMDLIVFKVEEDSFEDAKAQLDKHLATFNITGSDEELAAARKDHGPPGPGHAIVIDGDALKLVLGDDLRQKFLLLCKKCKSVLCCRVSPSQKAAMVEMVKMGLDVMTLSVGDGANDVAMIQEADVGVGIAGEEGRQAAMSSDYAIGQFRFLQRLVLVHGRWSYKRVSETIANFFYKNMMWTLTLFWYGICINFDGTYLFDYVYILMVNLFFTSLPIIFMGILDQDVSDKVSLAVPQLYRRGIERKEWTQLKFWVHMVDGAYQSVMAFFLVYLLFAPAESVSGNGSDLSERERMGAYVAHAAVILINFYILMNTYRWDWLLLILVVFSDLLVWFATSVYTAVTASAGFYKAAGQLYGTLSFWVTILLIIFACLLPRFAAKSIQKVFFPRDVDIIREQVRQGNFKYLDNYDAYIPPARQPAASASSSEISKPSEQRAAQAKNVAVDDDDTRPIYPPSIAQTNTTHNPRSQNGSDGTDYTGHRMSLDQQPAVRTTSMDRDRDRPRPSFDRMMQSMDRIRPSFEASNDITTAAMLTRMESSHSVPSSVSKIGRGASGLR